jgi:hypothetical protein
MTHTNSKDYARLSGPRDRELRVGDSEREAVAGVLREQHLEGRLTSDEFQDRLDRCLAAKTFAELDALVEDFPTADEPGRNGRGRALRSWPFALVPLVVIAIAASGGHLFWLAFPLIFFFVVRPLLWRSRGFRGYSTWACGRRHPIGGQA